MTARDRTLIAVALAIGAVAAAWLLVVGPKRSEASRLGSQISSTHSQLSAVSASVLAGEAARAQFASSLTSMASLGEAVPVDDNVPSLILQVQSAAAASRIDFQSLVLTAGGSAPAAAPTTSASATQASTAALPPGTTVGPAGFPTEPFTFTFNGDFFRLSDFLGRLERSVTTTNDRIRVSGRLLSLNAISLGAGPGGFPAVTATVAATTYILPSSQGVLAGASVAGPAASTPAAAVPSSSGSAPLAPAAIGAPGR